MKFSLTLMMDHFNGLSGLELAVKLVKNDHDKNPCPPSLSHSGEGPQLLCPQERVGMGGEVSARGSGSYLAQ